jgi:hypothetical protein
MMSFGPGFPPSATKGHPAKSNETEKNSGCLGNSISNLEAISQDFV